MNLGFSTEQIQEYADLAVRMIIEFTPKLILAFITLVIGWFIINRINYLIGRFFEKQRFDPSVESFLMSLISIGLKVMLLFSVVSMLGVQTTSFVALLGAAGLAIGLALQGSLSNFAGGVLILIFKPFKIGDYIEAQGFFGTVRSIQIFSTVLETAQHKKIIIPNGELSNNAVTNWTAKRWVRVDMVFGIGYEDDIDKARKVIEKVLKTEQDIINENKDQEIFVGNLGASSVDFFVRVWTKPNDSWHLPYRMNEKIKKAFDKEGITIPYPQQDIHLHKK